MTLPTWLKDIIPDEFHEKVRAWVEQEKRESQNKERA